jgi:tetratricopeptide (TPR) repeat protein
MSATELGTYTNSLFRAGLAEAQSGNLGESLCRFKQVTQLAPRHADAWLWLGRIASRQQDDRTAERCFAQAQRLGHPQAMGNLKLLVEQARMAKVEGAVNQLHEPQLANLAQSLIEPVSDASAESTVSSEIPSANVKQILTGIKSPIREQRLASIQQARDMNLKEFVPTLLDRYQSCRSIMGKDESEKLLILEALADLSDGSIALDLFKSSGKASSLSTTRQMAKTLAKLGRCDLAASIVERHLRPNDQDKDEAHNLGFVLLAPEVGDARLVAAVCKNILPEKNRWAPGFSWGGILVYPDPVAMLITGTLSVVATVAANAWNRTVLARDGQGAGSLMVSAEPYINHTFGGLTDIVKLMVALHCYSTALSSLATRYQAEVRAELNNRTKPIEQAVICLALAQNGDTSIQTKIEALCHDSAWYVRLLAFEALLKLTDAVKVPPPQLLLAALQDADVRIVIAIAGLMVQSGKAAYEIPLLALANTGEPKLRQLSAPLLTEMSGKRTGLVRERLTATVEGGRALASER